MSENNATTTSIPARGVIDPDAVLAVMRSVPPMPYGKIIVTTTAVADRLRAMVPESDGPVDSLAAMPIEAFGTVREAKLRWQDLWRDGREPILVVEGVA